MKILTEDFESFLRKNRKLIAIVAIALLLSSQSLLPEP